MESRDIGRPLSTEIMPTTVTVTTGRKSSAKHKDNLFHFQVSAKVLKNAITALSNTTLNRGESGVIRVTESGLQIIVENLGREYKLSHNDFGLLNFEASRLKKFFCKETVIKRISLGKVRDELKEKSADKVTIHVYQRKNSDHMVFMFKIKRFALWDHRVLRVPFYPLGDYRPFPTTSYVAEAALSTDSVKQFLEVMLSGFSEKLRRLPKFIVEINTAVKMRGRMYELENSENSEVAITFQYGGSLKNVSDLASRWDLLILKDPPLHYALRGKFKEPGEILYLRPTQCPENLATDSARESLSQWPFGASTSASSREEASTSSALNKTGFKFSFTPARLLKSAFEALTDTHLNPSSLGRMDVNNKGFELTVLKHTDETMGFLRLESSSLIEFTCEKAVTCMLLLKDISSFLMSIEDHETVHVSSVDGVSVQMINLDFNGQPKSAKVAKFSEAELLQKLPTVSSAFLYLMKPEQMEHMLNSMLNDVFEEDNVVKTTHGSQVKGTSHTTTRMWQTDKGRENSIITQSTRSFSCNISCRMAWWKASHLGGDCHFYVVTLPKHGLMIKYKVGEAGEFIILQTADTVVGELQN